MSCKGSIMFFDLCLDGPNSRSQLFTKPFVRRFIGESRMPCHEIRKGLDLTRRFHDAHTSHDRSDLDAQFGALFHTQDFLEGRNAEAEGRKPVYQGK
jgi:hypothetical protein